MSRNKNTKGFTLIELMVTMGIMLLLLSVMIGNYSGLAKKRNMNIAKSNAVSDIRKTQSLALSSKDIAPGVIAGYYGTSFSLTNPSKYFFIADDNNGNRQSNPTTVNLPPNVNLTNIRVTRVNGSVVFPTSIEILFRTAYGRSYLTYSGNSTNAVKESDDSVRLTFLSMVDNITTFTIDINGITGNVSPSVVLP